MGWIWGPVLGSALGARGVHTEMEQLRSSKGELRGLVRRWMRAAQGCVW